MPPGMQIAGAWSWRILAILAVIAVFIWLVVTLERIVVPFLIGIVITALLAPLSAWLQHHGVPKWASVVVSILAAIAAVVGLIWLVVNQISAAYPSLARRTVEQYANIKQLLLDSGIGISQRDFVTWSNDIGKWLQTHSGSVLSGVATAGSSATRVFEGLFIVLFTTIFLLVDGKRVWRWIVVLFPRGARSAIDGAGVAGWSTLTSFIRVQIFVAFVDAVGIGAGVFFSGVPLAIPIAVVVFLGSFVPVVGAIVTGVLAVFVALLFNGWVIALVVLGIVLLVQQIEGHLLQPLVMGSAVRVHPLAVVLGVAAASGLAGIAGAFFAVPLIATLNTMVTTVASGRWRRLDSQHVEAGIRSERQRHKHHDEDDPLSDEPDFAI